MSRFARRDPYVVGLANFVLRFASPHYQKMLKGSIGYGLEAAARDAGYPVPLPFNGPLDDE